MRVFFVAQRGRCPYCSRPLNAIEQPSDQKARTRATWDHVLPKSGGGWHKTRNKVLAHSDCNTKKGRRLPTACERLYLEIINQIVDDLRGSQ